MKVLLISLVVNCFLVSFLFSQENEGRLLTNSELDEVYSRALKNSDVITYMETLKDQGYIHEPENSIAVKRESDGAVLINLAFNKGNDRLTSHIIYRNIPGQGEKVSFWEGMINEDGSVSTLTEYEISNGLRGRDIELMSKVTAGHCILSICVGALVGCILTNCAYLKCAAGGCVSGLVSCLLLWAFGGF